MSLALVDAPVAEIPEETPDGCPAGGDHTPERLTAWDQGCGLRDYRLRPGWFCQECGVELLAEEPWD